MKCYLLNYQMTSRSTWSVCSFLLKPTWGWFMISSTHFLLINSFLLLLALNQLTPSSWQFLDGFYMVLTNFKVPPITSLFHYFFQLKIVKPSVFYFMAWQEVQFLTGFPSSHKGKKELLFFVCPPTSFDFSTEWIYALPTRPPSGPLLREGELQKGHLDLRWLGVRPRSPDLWANFILSGSKSRVARPRHLSW